MPAPPVASRGRSTLRGEEDEKMIDTGKKARRIWGTRAKAKRAKGSKGKTFEPVMIHVKDYRTGERALQFSRSLGMR
jgi:hypothetical protein